LNILPRKLSATALASLIAGSVVACSAIPAWAQKTAENATTQSSDAFGTAIGNERTGLYNPDEVRGFNPVEAGNARIEGLYFDQVAFLPMRITDGSTIRVGITAQHYPFPAPTGLVDYAITKAGGSRGGSFNIDSGPFAGPGASVEVQVPLDGARLALAIGFGGRNSVRSEGGSSRLRNVGATLAIRPYTGAMILLLGGGFINKSDEAHATLFPAGAYLPPEIPRGEFLGQPWTQRETVGSTFGAIAKLPVAGFRIEAGLFDTRRNNNSIFADLVSGVTPDGRAASRTIIADGNNVDKSLSGEFRLVRQWVGGSFKHIVTASLRGRAKDRDFGGSQRIALGTSSAITADFRALPTITLGPENKDRVRQLTYGLAYDLIWSGGGSIGGSIAKSRYTKRVDFADPLVTDTTTRDAPLLWNIAASYSLSSRLAAYFGMSRGQEEALIAPDIASNRSEAPPAIRTRQTEAGFRFAVTPKVTLVAGVFTISKPYYNLDPALRYRQLGEVTHRGVEVSVTGQIVPGVSLVGGMVLLDPRIAGEAVDSGLIGQRPVGQVKRRIVANLDWRLNGGKSPLSFDLALEAVSSRMANAANTLSAPARSNFNLGARYRFTLAGLNMLLRPQVQNVLNSYGWQVSSSGGFTYVGARNAQVDLVVDF